MKSKKGGRNHESCGWACTFLVGINVGFVTAGLMHAAKGEDEQTEDENKTC